MQQQEYKPPKNPYLIKYKSSNNPSPQKSINQRLGYTPSRTDETTVLQHLEKESFPSIDDENADQQQHTDRPYKSTGYSYFDNEAEKSLQFFKKNLLPKSKTITTTTTTTTTTATTTTEPVETKRSTSNLLERESVLDSIVAKNDHNGLSPYGISSTQGHHDKSSRMTASSIYEDYNSRYPAIASSRPVSLKQDVKREPLAEHKPKNRAAIPENEDYTQDHSPQNRYRSSSSSSRHQVTHTGGSLRSTDLNNEDNANGTSKTRNKHSPSSGSLRHQNKSASSKHSSGDNNNVNNRRQQMTDDNCNNELEESNRRRTKANQSPILSDSPIPAETFARKPLYNSLLRAHDSIRLKVNRPKVRPKSEATYQVEDTQVDDSVQLAEIDSDPSVQNERPVDVKRKSSKRKSKRKAKEEGGDGDHNDATPVRNFSEVRVVKVVRTETERSLGVTVEAEGGNIVVARILAGGLADKQGALQVGDIILSVNNREVYTPEQLQEQLRKTMHEEVALLKIVPSFREELPTLCIYLRALFSYDANEDSLLPCKEVGVSFNQGDILEVVNQEDPNWWQARRVDSENLQAGLIPSQELEERRRAFVLPDYDLATRTSICGTKVSRKSKRKEIYNIGQNCDFDKAELQLYEEVCRTPAFERRTLVLIGANGVGKQAFKSRLVAMDPDRFGSPLPHTSRLPREGEEDGVHYHFVTREKMEEDIIEGKYLEYGEYDGALYGTKLDSIREIIGSGKVCVLDCSPTCLKILKTSDYLPFVAFIAAPTLDQLRYMHEWNRGNKTYATFDRALSRQSRRARTLQDFAFDFFEDEDLQVTVEESARLFRMYENYFDIVLVNNHFERAFEQLRDAIDALSMAPQWIPISWIYGT